ncbi:hypothetical protein Cob_v010168 [Colletotrichum orbiculare MAFF 240422]|uniref:Uncharacterized protein n=1 Tax=Colletotrichum orbiculare (strain 104-T / ATCC 96160 / CBS 514.97 / LARS 414 / MAFF 240422) TaxID=1213857 RepID=A0A484FGT4_COLOR|nr:hypothetical protein Cob_v010168 [Colletotrichum orbiculare MAFF 240422]
MSSNKRHCPHGAAGPGRERTITDNPHRHKAIVPRGANVPISQSPPQSTYQDPENGSEVPEEEAESDASSSPPPLQSKHRPKYVVNWRSELCRLLQLSETATDENILDGIEEAEEKLRDAERRQYQSVADPGPPRFQVVYAIKCGVSVSSHTNDTFYLDPPWAVQSGPFKAHLRGSGNIRNMELYLERNKSVSALVYREYQCCGYDFQGQRPSQFDHLSEADLSKFFLREYIELVSAESRAALTALSHAALINLPHPDFDDGKPANTSLYQTLFLYPKIEEALRLKLTV